MATTTTARSKRAYSTIGGIVAAAEAQRKRSARARTRRLNYQDAMGALPYQRQNRIYGRPSAAVSEVKSFDVVVAAANMVAAAAVAGTEPAAAYTGMTEINCMQQGATVAQRIGNKVVIKSVQAVIEFSSGAAAAVAGIRALLVYDKQPNGAFPALADILLDQPAGTGMALSSINIANKSRFQFIRDQYACIDPGVGQEFIMKIYCKGRWEVEFGSNTNTVGDIKTGAIYLIMFYTRFGTSAPALSLCHTRVRYFD